MVLGLGGLGSGIALTAGAAGSDGKRYAREALKVWQALKTSNFDMSSLSPPEQRLVAEYFPQMFDAQTQGLEPAMMQDDAASQTAQSLALRQMQDVASGGMPLADQLATQDIGRAVTGDARRAQLNALQSMRARGLGGGGVETLGGQAAGQQAAELSRGYGSDVMREALSRRLGAIGASGNLAGQMRGQALDVNAQRAMATNNWNNLVANLRTNAAAQNAQATNQGRQLMFGERQRISDQNTMNRYNTQLQNINRQNMLRGQSFDQNLAKTAGMSGAWGQLGQYQNARQASKASAIRGVGEGSDNIGGGLLEGLLGG